MYIIMHVPFAIVVVASKIKRLKIHLKIRILEIVSVLLPTVIVNMGCGKGESMDYAGTTEKT